MWVFFPLCFVRTVFVYEAVFVCLRTLFAFEDLSVSLMHFVVV